MMPIVQSIYDHYFVVIKSDVPYFESTIYMMAVMLFYFILYNPRFALTVLSRRIIMSGL